MSVPTFHVSISGNVVALYAAVLSTITAAVQIMNFLRDRREIKISVSHRMKMYGDPRYENKLLTMVRVSNTGRRPVTILSIGASQLAPLDSFVLMDTRPALPCELTEGKYFNAIAELVDIDTSKIARWEVGDAAGNLYQLPVASWWERFQSRRRRKRIWREEAARKAVEGKLKAALGSNRGSGPLMFAARMVLPVTVGSVICEFDVPRSHLTFITFRL
ncbi:MAG: hypothetical protein WAL71_20845 [Terriglobales bacterium]|jgi:hypothetical protein